MKSDLCSKLQKGPIKEKLHTEKVEAIEEQKNKKAIIREQGNSLS